MPTVRAGEVAIYYEVHGTGYPLLMINGLGSSVEMWSPFWKRLAEHYRVILFDNRGVGRSTVPDTPYTISAMAEDAANLLNALGIPSAFVYGASMGGQIAQSLVLDFPQKVQALVLGMTTSGGKHAVLPSPETMAKLAQLARPQPGITAQEILWSVEYTPEFLESHRAELEREAASVRYPTSPIGFRRQSEASMSFDSYDRLPSIRTPTLVLAGSRDILMRPENARLIASRVPGARLHIVEGAAHGFTREKPAESINVILEFLSSVEASSTKPSAA
jgi:3-oxoadipate enol-lactonase